MCYNRSMQDVITPFYILICHLVKIIFMEEEVYDYVYEVTKRYPCKNENNGEVRIDYDEIAKKLSIVSASGRKPVTEGVRRTFEEAYRAYVEGCMRKVNNQLAIFMFQGTYKPLTQINRPRRGMTYVSDYLREVTRKLPKLPKGERYVFPALKVIRAEEDTKVFVLNR